MTRKLVCEIKSPMLAFIQAAKHFRGYGGVDRSRRIPIGPHARLSRSPATALPIASGPSLYPLGTSKSIPPSRPTNLASIRLGLRFAIAGTSLMEPSESGSYAKTCPGFTCGSLTRWRSSTVNVFIRGNSHWKATGSSFFRQLLSAFLC